MATLDNIVAVVNIILFAISSFFCSISAQSQTYIVHIDQSAMPKAFSTHKSWFESTLSSISENSQVPIASKLIHSYRNSIHGFSASLTPSELEALKNSPGYIHSTPDRPLKPHTTHTSKFLGLSTNSGLWPASSFGEGVIIGVVDTGVWPESKSFSDKGITKVPSRWKGECVSGEKFNSSLCNKKLIGARFYNKGLLADDPEFKITMNSSRDDDGHGTHTASTAAGNYVEGASYFGYAAGTANGMAPRAHLAIYKTIWRNSVVSSDVLAAIDQAIEDGVDILSLSLGLGPGDDYFLEDDAMAVATFAAMKRGVFISASAGNGGPMAGTVINGAPWITTVAAGTVDRLFKGEFILGNGVRISFDSLYPGNSSQVQVPLVFLDGCEDVNQMKQVKKKIIVCKDNLSISDQVDKAQSANVRGAIFISNISLSSLYIRSSFAAAFIGLKDGQTVINYIEKGQNPTGRLEFQKTVLGTKPAPKVDSYSSRGPFLTFPNLLKPDIMAPGSSILASWSPISPVAEVQKRSLFSNFNIDSGTSMAAPHVAGVAALIKAVHPNWSPAAIRSALMTTANPLDNTQNSIEDATWGYSGLQTGAGHIDPNKAVDPGLIYDATAEDYVKFLCGLNYTAQQIQIITKSKHKCVERSLDLNYPSFIAYFNGVGGSNSRSKVVREFMRTVTNVGVESSSYTANLTAMNELNVKVEPKKLVFKKKYEKQSYKLTLEGPKLLKEESILGSLSWVEDTGKYVVRSPIVATNIDPSDLKE